MYVYKDEYNTKEFRNVLRRLEKAIKEINSMGFVPFCGGGVNIHRKEDAYNFSNENIVATLDGVFAEGEDY
jgi:hypothetical protein